VGGNRGSAKASPFTSGDGRASRRRPAMRASAASTPRHGRPHSGTIVGEEDALPERRLDGRKRPLLRLADVLPEIDEQLAQVRELVGPEDGGDAAAKGAGPGGDGGGDHIAVPVVLGGGVGAVVQRQGELLPTRREDRGCPVGHRLLPPSSFDPGSSWRVPGRTQKTPAEQLEAAATVHRPPDWREPVGPPSVTPLCAHDATDHRAQLGPARGACCPADADPVTTGVLLPSGGD
jgi:hypothetical protein